MKRVPKSEHRYITNITHKMPFCFEHEDKRKDATKEARHWKKYGVTSNECYNLDITMIYLLYERLRQYKIDAERIIDTKFYKFDIPVAYLNPEFHPVGELQITSTKKYVEKTENHTQAECIDIMIEYIERWLKADILQQDYEEQLFEFVWKIWAITNRTMWW